MKASRSATAVIRRDALVHNLACIRAAAPGRRMLAVVKADAYGHGVTACLPTLADADALAVACVSEAEGLRESGFAGRIVVLEGAMTAVELEVAIAQDLELVVHDALQLELLGEARPSRPLTIWLKIDTGMNRLGFRMEAAAAAWSRLQALSAVGEIRLMTHLACADVPQNPMTSQQLARFGEVTRGWDAERSIANSAAIFAFPQAHADWVRPGLALYGVAPFGDRDGGDLGLRPAMGLNSVIIAIREVAAGESVGYGAAWTASRPSRVGIVGIGYGDGYPREPGARAEVVIGGTRCPLVGRVSMDMLAVDLSGYAQARIGDEVELWGTSLPVEEVARRANTIPWTLLCSVTDRVTRVVT